MFKYILCVLMLLLFVGCAGNKPIELKMSNEDIESYFVEKEKAAGKKADAEGKYYDAVARSNEAKGKAGETYVRGYTCPDPVYDDEGKMIQGCETKIGEDVQMDKVERIDNEYTARIVEAQVDLGQTQARTGMFTKSLEIITMPIAGAVVLGKAFGAAGNEIRIGSDGVVGDGSLSKDQISTSTIQETSSVSTEVAAAPAQVLPQANVTTVNVGQDGIYAEGPVDKTSLDNINDSGVALGGSSVSIDQSQQPQTDVGNVENQGNQQDTIDNTNNATCVINPVTGVCN